MNLKRTLLPLLMLAAVPQTAHADDSTLDSTFGSGGIAAPSLASTDEEFEAIAVQPDGKLVAAGRSGGGADADFLVARFRSDGTLDPAFGDGGMVRTAVGSGEDRVNDVALQPNGRILVVGSADNAGGGTNFAIVRYLPDGKRDNSFSLDGRKSVPVAAGAQTDVAEGAVMASGGKIVLAGKAYDAGSLRLASARLTSVGNLDTSYCGTGKCVLAMPGNFGAEAVADGPGNTVLVAGRYRPSPGSRLATVVRINAAGALDDSFASDGIASSLLGPHDEILNDVAVGGDGSIVATGWAAANPDGSDRQVALVKLTPGGLADQSFGGGDGRVTTPIAASGVDDHGRGVAIQPDGRIVVIGYTLDMGDATPALMRFDATGTLDPSFSGNGVRLILEGDSTGGYAVAAAPGGRTVVAGYVVGAADIDAALLAFAAPAAPGDPGQPAPDPAPGGGTPAGNDPPAPGTDVTAPLLTKVSLSAAVFRAKKAAHASKHRPLGTKLRYTLSEPARMTVIIERRAGHHRLGKLKSKAHVGRNTLRFKGKVGGKLLRTGRYVARLRAVDAAGNRSAERRVRFRVVA